MSLTELPDPRTLTAVRDALDSILGPTIGHQMSPDEYEARLDLATVAVADVACAPHLDDDLSYDERVEVAGRWLSSAQDHDYPVGLLLE